MQETELSGSESIMIRKKPEALFYLWKQNPVYRVVQSTSFEYLKNIVSMQSLHLKPGPFFPTMTVMLVHTVFFYLKPEVTEQQKADFLQGIHMLKEIPTVKGFYVGTPAATPDRPVIDKSYGAALTVIFDDVAGHDVYGPHKIHDAFIAKYKHLWERVAVYDAD